MAEQSGFFDSIDHDRVYASAWLASYVAAIISNGVYNLELAVMANDNMSVRVEAGRAWINGYFYRNVGNYNLNIDIADGVLNRKDLVVLRFDINKRAINLMVVKGEYASTAVAPSVTRNAEVYDLELCQISVPAGTTKITQSLITDKRLDKNLCGIVHGVVDQIDTNTLLKQMEDWFMRFQTSAWDDLNTLEMEFNQWFASIQDKFAGDIAGSLQSQIDKKIETIQIAGVTQTKTNGVVNITQVATASRAGLMNTTDKSKLDSLGKNLTFTGAVTGTYNGQSAKTALIPDRKGCRFIVGTSTAGHTAKDCDYLCDGTADQVEINNAINALPSTGGEVVVLAGTYNITASITVNKSNVKLRGNGDATVLKRMWNGTAVNGVIYVTGSSCCIEGFYINGNKASYNYNDNNGIYIPSSNRNRIIGNTCFDNGNGIKIHNLLNNIVIGNICNNNITSGINCSNSDKNIIVGNTCCDNSNYGINLFYSNENTIIGNLCYNNNYGIYTTQSYRNSIIGNTCNSNKRIGICLFTSSGYNAITGNACNSNAVTGIKIYSIIYSAITGNTCNFNSVGIEIDLAVKNSIIGNTCCDNSSIGIKIFNSSSSNNITGNMIARDSYTSSQYSIQVESGSNNLIADNMIWGKNYTNNGTNNTFVNNKYN